MPKSSTPHAYNVDAPSELLKDVLLGSNPSSAQNKVWRRDFVNGIVLVNPTTSDRTDIVLNGSFRKILGQDRNIFNWSDPDFNNGDAVSSNDPTEPFSLDKHSGIILLNP